jgi:hypothetical protein
MKFIGFNSIAVFVVAIFGFGLTGMAQENKTPPLPADVIIWQPVDIRSRDVLRGPTSEGIAPALDNVKFLGRQTGGNNLKYRIEDANGNEWVVKIADESQAEVAATRLIWALGYRTEIDHIVPRISIEKIGNYKNARFEGRPKTIKRGERWSWTNHPHTGTKEFDGLRIMMAFVNNWDLKDENNIIIEDGGKSYLVVSDLGSSFGKLADKSKSRSGRSVNEPEDFAKAGFVKGVNNGIIELDYRGMGEDHLKGIKVENARWLADLLLQLTDKQISDAFRAANYSNEDVNLYTAAVKARISALDNATKQAVAETSN